MEFRHVMHTSTLYCPGHQRHTVKVNTFYLENFIQMPTVKVKQYTQDSDLPSHTTYAICCSFIHELRVVQFKGGAEQWISYLAILFTLEIFARNLLRGSRRRYIFFFHNSFCSRCHTQGEKRAPFNINTVVCPIRFFFFFCHSPLTT